MRAPHGDGVTGLGLPLLGESGVVLLVELTRGVIGRIEQGDVFGLGDRRDQRRETRGRHEGSNRNGVERAASERRERHVGQALQLNNDQMLGARLYARNEENCACL